MEIKLSDHFTYGRLFKFVLPSVVMMVFTSIYGVVDGFFVSNFVGKIPFAALNLIMPFLMIIATIGFMMGTGGSAIVAKALGEGKNDKANAYFSLIVYFLIAIGLVITVISYIFMPYVARLLKADAEMMDHCILYGRIVTLGLVFFMLQNLFQSFMVTAQKPKLGLLITVAAGVTNMVLDFLFTAVFRFGIAGAAAATALSQVVGGGLGLVYFIRKNSSLLRLTKPEMNGKVLLKTCTNGSSELMTNVSLSLVNILYNTQLMNIIGKDGVAAYGVIMYVAFIFVSIFIGYSIGVAPVIGFNYGRDNREELRNMKNKSFVLITVSGILLTVAAIAMSPVLSKIFVGYDRELFELTEHAFSIYSYSFFFAGFGIFGSAFFTALNDGLVSAIISFLRTLVFQVFCVLALPVFFGIDGIWGAVVLAEILSMIVALIFIAANRKKYGY